MPMPMVVLMIWMIAGAMIVIMLVMRMVAAVVMVVIVAVPMIIIVGILGAALAFHIGAAFRIERGFDYDHTGAETLSHRLDDRIAADAQCF
jgi:hypothetical protein